MGGETIYHGTWPVNHQSIYPLKVESILVIRRKDNGKLACIGGFVEVGEKLEDTVRREVMEETGLAVTDIRMIPTVYDDPARDVRRHTVSIAFVVRATGKPRPGSEEEAIVKIPLDEVRHHLEEFAFDHSQVRGKARDGGVRAILN